jgi:hypothetical protein
MSQTATNAKIIVNSALDFMADQSGASHADILSAMLADPAGNVAKRFRALVALGTEALNA